MISRAIAFEIFPAAILRGARLRRAPQDEVGARQQFQRALTPISLILRRRVSAVSKDEACAQSAATSHMRLPCL
ncbi:hypothetical protein ACM43_14935 [Bradyrhizobium sp. CCBAU 45321]|nr:hypothetical protein [Bradyrhizobium sp. CCBAU 45321]